MKSRSLEIKAPRVLPEALGYFRFGRIGERVVITNDAGEWQLLSEPDWARFLAGEIAEGDPLYASLHAKGFLRGGIDLDALAGRVARKKAYLQAGPHLHVVITTLRCQQSCLYCHASRASMDRVDTDMSLETARGVVDHAMRSTSPDIIFEFQGGEPTVNMPAIRFIVDYARERNRDEGKQLSISLVSNFVGMNEEIAEWLLANEVYLCTSLDGPRDLHDANRPTTGGGAYDRVMHWMAWFNRRYVEMGREPDLWHVDALMTTTRASLSRGREIVDLYASLGLRNIQLRPLNPYGFAARTWKRAGYPVESFLDFYAQTLDYIIEKNREGVELAEGTAAVFLAKMLTPDDPNYVDIRSPCGAGTGQVAYGHDGRIFPCDEARMVAAMGDGLFALGSVGEQSLEQTLKHPTVRAMAVASLTDALPGCTDCWNKPFCGVCPVHNYASGGDLFGQRPRSPLCRLYYGISSLLLGHLARDEDGAVEAIFRRWILRRPRVDEAC